MTTDEITLEKAVLKARELGLQKRGNMRENISNTKANRDIQEIVRLENKPIKEGLESLNEEFKSLTGRFEGLETTIATKVDKTNALLEKLIKLQPKN